MTDQPAAFEGDATSKTTPKAASNERLRQRAAAAARTVRLRLGPNAIAMAQRGEPVILNLNEADDLAIAVLTELGRELDAFAEYENTITWLTTCTSCARVLDSSIRETERAEHAERRLAEIRDRAAKLTAHGLDAMSATFIIGFIDGISEPARTTANNPATSPAATEATQEQT